MLSAMGYCLRLQVPESGKSAQGCGCRLVRRLSASSVAALTPFPSNAGMWSWIANARVLLGMLLQAASTARSMRHNWGKYVAGKQEGSRQPYGSWHG